MGLELRSGHRSHKQPLSQISMVDEFLYTISAWAGLELFDPPAS
jgi:hypothetical protein